MLFSTLLFVVCVVRLTAAGLTAPCVEELAFQNVFVAPLNQYVSSDCNIICFGDFNAGTGDVEGLYFFSQVRHKKDAAQLTILTTGER